MSVDISNTPSGRADAVFRTPSASKLGNSQSPATKSRPFLILSRKNKPIRPPMPSTLHRRGFLQASAGAVASAPFGVGVSSALAAPAPPTFAKSDRIRLGVIGCGPQGHNSIRFTTDWFQVTAVSDVDDARRERSRMLLSDSKAAAFNDYRHVLGRDDVDAVYIATPDHWHAKQLIEAIRAGKDVYCEKPLTLTIDEGKQIKKVLAGTDRIVQVGTQQRSMFDQFIKAIAVVADGRIGKIKKITASLDPGPGYVPLPAKPVPKGLDWDRWLGPAPFDPYRSAEVDGRSYSNCFYNFRWWLQYSGGKLTDWGAHHIDIACWALRANAQSDIPKTIAGAGKYGVDFKEGFPVQQNIYNTPSGFKFFVTMTDGVELVINSGRNGILFEGEKGRIFVNRGKLTGKPVEDLVDNPLPAGAIEKVYGDFPIKHSAHKAHWMNFAHCVQNRIEPVSDVATHMRALNICHLAGLAGRVGRTLTWDGDQEQIVGDEIANSLLSRTYREGYEIEG